MISAGAKSFSVRCSQLTVFPQPDVLLLTGYLRVCCHNSRGVQQPWLEFPAKNTAKFGGKWMAASGMRQQLTVSKLAKHI